MTATETPRSAGREQTRARYPDETGYAERGGVRVFWERYGEGEPAVLFLPTWSIVHSRVWKAQIPYFARRGRVLTFDGRGNGRSDRPTEPEAYAPSEFVAAWRHIVTLFQGQGVTNVTWLWTLQADETGTGPIASWWPGAQYVTWVGIDGYYYRRTDTFFSIFGTTIAQVRMFTTKPVLVSETAVEPQADQAAKIANLFAGIRQYDLLGVVWFDITQHNGLYHQNWRIEDSPAAQTAFKRGASTLTLTAP